MNCVICNLVKSTQGNPKITIHGYLYVKEKSINQRYYWCCEFRKKNNCNGRAIIDLENEEHVLISTKEHNHAPEANRVDVIKTIDIMKDAASHTRIQPAQIIQNGYESKFIFLYAKQTGFRKTDFTYQK